MGDIEKKTTAQVKEFGGQLKEMPTDMRIFSLTMRSLYAEKAVGTNGELAKRLWEMCDKTRDDALVYLRGILAISAVFVASISEYLEYYEALEYEEWVDMISDILEETVGYRGLCEAVLKMHEDIMVPSKRRKDEANLMARELLASLTRVSLIPALDRFLGGLAKAAGFFSMMEQQLRKFEGRAEKAQGAPKRLYYKVMNKEGKDMKSFCQIFYAVLADVKTDFLAIPQDGTDRNYVDRWLENQKKTIREKCNVTKHVQKLLKAITD